MALTLIEIRRAFFIFGDVTGRTKEILLFCPSFMLFMCDEEIRASSRLMTLMFSAETVRRTDEVTLKAVPSEHSDGTEELFSEPLLAETKRLLLMGFELRPFYREFFTLVKSLLFGRCSTWNTFLSIRSDLLEIAGFLHAIVKKFLSFERDVRIGFSCRLVSLELRKAI